uniref:Uncharacterized protein n=1 Tax=Kalanchoe fedtschenkoi TaxID=63787 RepID=A0A7N0UD15_KALFE
MLPLFFIFFMLAHGIILVSQRCRKSKKKWFAKQKDKADSVNGSAQNEPVVPSPRTMGEEPGISVSRTGEEAVVGTPWSILEEPYAPLVVEEVKPNEAGGQENDYAYDVAVAKALAAEAAAVSAQAAAEVVRLTNLTRFAGKSKEEVAAIKIQTAFRGHMARRALRALRGLVRLKSLMQGSCIKRQSMSTLRCMQTLSRVQSQIRARRIRMSEENQALQRQLQQKHENEMEKMKLTIGDDWNDSTKSKEKLEASLRQRQEAAVRRERALAYAHAQQQKWRSGSKTLNPTIMDPINPHWGWSWLERWMAARPWEGSTEEASSGRSSAIRPLSVEEISRAYYAHRERHPDNSNKPLPIPQRSSSRISTRRSLSTPRPKVPPPASSSGMTTKAKTPGSSSGQGVEESKSIQSRRHSLANSSVSRNASSLSGRSSYTAATEAQRPRSRLQKSSSTSNKTSSGKVEIGSLAAGSAKKRLSFSSPAESRRHSGPPVVDLSPIQEK